MIPSPFFRPQTKELASSASSSSTSSNDEENDALDRTFFHNPYPAVSPMNYIDIPQQQYSNARSYPTYLAEQQTLDDQIHEKLFSLQQRGKENPVRRVLRRRLPDPRPGEPFDFASVVLWYRQVMRSMKKLM